MDLNISVPIKGVVLNVFSIIVNSSIILICSKVLGLLISLVTANLISPAEFGYYSVLTSIVMILCIPTASTFPIFIVKVSTKYVGIEDDYIINLENNLRKLVFIYSLFLGLASIIYVFKVEYNVYLLSIGVLVFLQSMNSIRNSILKVYDKLYLSQSCELIVRPLTLLSVLLVFYFSHREISIEQYIVYYSLSFLVAFILGEYFIYKFVHSTKRVRGSSHYHKEDLKSTYLNLVAFIAVNVISLEVNTLIMATYGLYEEAAYYKIAMQLALLVGFLLKVNNNSLSPMYAKLIGQKKKYILRDKLTQTSLLMTVFSLIVGGFFFVYGRDLISLTYGQDYLDTYPILIMLTVSYLINVVFGPVALILNLYGHQKVTRNSSLISLTCNIILSVVLTKQYGGVGAALSFLIANLVWNIYMTFKLYAYEKHCSNFFNIFLRD